MTPYVSSPKQSAPRTRGFSGASDPSHWATALAETSNAVPILSFTDPHTHIPVLHGADQALERRHGRPKDQHIPNAKITWASLSLAPRDGASLPLSQPSAYSTPVTLPTDDGPGTLLIRASDGAGKQQKGTKISTVVRPEELDVFFARYADVCKAGMGALKKRDRKKRKKVKKGDKVEKVAAP